MNALTPNPMPFAEAARYIANLHDTGELKVGDVILHERLMEFGGFDERNLDYHLTFITPLKRELLETHQILLDNDFGVGYRIVPPGEMTSVGTSNLKADLRNALKRTGSIFENTPLHKLDDNQRRENAEARAKLATLSVMLRERLKF